MIIVIVGPTAVGKTKLSVKLAKILNGEIINADSTQVYRGMDIGTCKVTDKEKEHIPHYLFDIVDVNEVYTVFDYQRDCRAKIEEIQSKNKIPILVGGTGLYIKAALYDYDFVTDSKEDYSSYSLEELKAKVLEKDPDIVLDFDNRRRVERALAILDSGEIQEKGKEHLLYPDVIFIGLTTDREELYKRINQREDEILVPLIDEVHAFYQKGIHSKALQTAIGYKELYSFFDGSSTLSNAVEKIKQNCRNYAKRQYTWFENQMDVHWITTNYENFDETIQTALDIIIK